MKLKRNSKTVKDNERKAISINFKPYNMNTSKSFRYLTDYMIIFIKPMKQKRIKRPYPINYSHMSRMNSLMKNKSCNQSRKNY